MTVPDYPTDGTYHQVSVLIYDDTNSMIVNRNPWDGCHLYLLTPKTVDSIDRIGTATFSLLDVGDSSATEKSLMVEAKNVVFITGKTITFSGKIRRITQNTQNGFTTSTRAKVWDVECDSDLAKLQKVNIDSTVLTTGAAIYDTPGNIARLILTPTSPARDTRGVISCVDAKVSYQLNSSTAEQAGDQYTHMMALSALTNYDLRSRADFLLYNYTAFDGSTIITNSAAAWTDDEFIGMYAIFVGRDVPASKTFTTNYAVNNDRLLITDANLYFAINDRVALSTSGTLPTGLSATTYYVKSVTSTYITISTSIGGSAVTFSTDGTGTHSIIMKAETNGVMTYGKITDNDATTITCTMVNASVAPQSLGYFIIYRGYLIDFAHDLSQPSVIKNFDVNKDVFEFSDNDDKRKLSTKIVATGKDLQGITISVSLSAVHNYDSTTQFFEDSTSITYPSEGYIFNNAYTTRLLSVTAHPAESSVVFTTNYTTDPTKLFITNPENYFHVDECITVTNAGSGSLPAGLAESTDYYINSLTSGGSGYITLSTLGQGDGQPNVTLTSDGTGTHYAIFIGQMQVSSERSYLAVGTPLVFYGTMPTGLTAGTQYYSGTANGPFFFVCSDTAGATRISFAGTGSSIVMTRNSDIVNPLTSPVITPKVYIYGRGFAIPTGTVMAMVTPQGSAVAVTTSGTPSDVVFNNGTLGMAVQLTQMPTADYSNKGYLMSPRLYVDDHSKVGTNEVLIGEEKITIPAVGNDTTYGNYIDVGAATSRISSASIKCYPHGVGALVARTNYTEASPQSASAVATYGLYIDKRTVDSNITYGTLDSYVSNLLLGLGNFYKKANTWGPIILVYVPHVGEYYGGLAQTSLQMPPRPADRVSFTEYTGGTPVEYQIVAVTIDHDKMTVSLELGDFEKNVFTSLQQSTNAVNRTLT